MADLDDFFAKKDRKKAKGKKFTTTEEIAKKLEETAKKPVEKIKIKEKSSDPEEENTQPREDDEEWKEFEEEKKDYSGLKIGNLTVNEHADGDSEDQRGTGESGSDGESGETSSRSTGPWRKADGAAAAQAKIEAAATAAAAAAATAPAPATAPAGNAIGQKYKSPHLRHQTTSSPATRSSRMKNVAPDIRSEEYFPTLNAKQPAVETGGVWGRRKRDEGTFEEVRNRGGTRSYASQEAQNQAPKLSLDNKYGALSQDQS